MTLKVEPGTCLHCAEKAIDGWLFAAGCAWLLSTEDGLNHWGREKSRRKCGELEATEYEVVCGRDFVVVVTST